MQLINLHHHHHPHNNNKHHQRAFSSSSTTTIATITTSIATIPSESPASSTTSPNNLFGGMAGGYLGGAGGLGAGLPPLPTEILMDEYMFGRRRQVSPTFLPPQVVLLTPVPPLTPAAITSTINTSFSHTKQFYTKK